MDKLDTVTMDVPLFIRALEHAREDVKTDADLHVFVERVLAASKEKDVLTMDDYNGLVPMKINASLRLIQADKWSAEVTEDVTKYPKEGTFKGSAASIAKELKRLHPDLKGAMSALNFYINRAGTDVPNKQNLEKAKDELHKLYGEK